MNEVMQTQTNEENINIDEKFKELLVEQLQNAFKKIHRFEEIVGKKGIFNTLRRKFVFETTQSYRAVLFGMMSKYCDEKSKEGSEEFTILCAYLNSLINQESTSHDAYEFDGNIYQCKIDEGKNAMRDFIEKYGYLSDNFINIVNDTLGFQLESLNKDEFNSLFYRKYESEFEAKSKRELLVDAIKNECAAQREGIR